MLRETLSRRTMLKGLGAAIGGGYATLDTTAAAFRKADWKVAIGLNGFESAGPKYGKQFPIRDVLKFASEAGFDGVELVKNWPQPYPASTDTHSIQDLRSLYEEFGLQVFSIQTSARDAFAPDASTRQRWMKQMRDRIALATAAHQSTCPPAKVMLTSTRHFKRCNKAASTVGS